MIALDVISEDQAAMMELTNQVMSKKGLMCGSFTKSEARKIMKLSVRRCDQLLSFMMREQLVTRHGHLYWINQGS